MNFCANDQCGPCADGEGDCDPGQCEAGLTCVEEGAVDHCRPAAGCTPNAMNFCANDQCGPCADGEGDCDPGQCDAGLTCVEEGAVDHCRPTAGCTPNAMNFCANDQCGPCADGEGDCDPGQCDAGLTCVEEGAVDHCRPTSGGSSNLEVKLNGVWEPVCCNGATLEISDQSCWWTEYDRTLTDVAAGLKLDCPEGGPTGCECNGSGERMHGIQGDLDSSIRLPDGGPIYSNELLETCVVVGASGELETVWTNPGCPSFRLE